MSLGYLKPWVDITEQERIEAALREGFPFSEVSLFELHHVGVGTRVDAVDSSSFAPQYLDVILVVNGMVDLVNRALLD